jgi:hypothetical protein
MDMHPSNFMEFAGFKRKPLFMEPIKNLIQQLMEAANSGEDKRVLLALVEDLRNELHNAAVHSAVPDSVSVVMPNGFLATPQSSGEPKPSIKPMLSVPRPPTVVVVDEVPEAKEPAIIPSIQPVPEPVPTPVVAEKELVEWSVPELPSVEMDEGNQEIVEIPMAEIGLPEMMPEAIAKTAPVQENHATVMNMELLLTPEMIAEAVALEMQALNPVEEPEWSQPQGHFRQEETPKEINDKMAQRSKMLNEVFVQQEPELVEVLAKPKIADLRKSISINEKYQFIGSLFRGDEDMFERSIKTLNNFTVMQEAQYWMQRELIIKLGWNEDDELVQRFFDLVSRRFV